MANKEKNFASAVIYIHNAENRIEGFLRMVLAVLEKNFEHSEIICVNDASIDKGKDIIKEVSKDAETSSISIVDMSYFHGLEMAMNAGMELTIGDFVFEFDSTILDFDEREIMKVYYRSLEGYDIVSASPDRKEKFTSRLFYKTFDHFSDVSCIMSTESFRVLSRRVINRICSMNITVPYRKAIYANCGLKTNNLKYHTIETVNVNSDKKEKNYRSGLAVDSLILFTKVGYKLSMAMTALMMAVSVFMVVYSIAIYTTAKPIEGWTTTILFLSVAFLGLFGVLTIIIKYLQLLIDLVFKKKHYSFESIEKLTK